MTKEELVQSIKDCGQSLIDNAEKIAAYEYLNDLTIICYPMEDNRLPRINIDTHITPEKFVKDLIIKENNHVSLQSMWASY